MRLLHVITSLKKAAGTSTFCAEIANGIADAGYDVTIAVCDPVAQDTCALNPRIRLISIGSVLSAQDSQCNIPYSVVHIHALWSPIIIRVAKWAWSRGVPVVWSPHGMLTSWAMHNKRLKKIIGWYLYQRKALAHAALLHATAESEVADIRRMGLKNRTVVVPLGVHSPAVVTNSSSSQRGCKILLFVSRVQRKKGLPILLDAWARLSVSVRRGWRIRIVGPDQDNHVAELMTQCNRLGLSYTAMGDSDETLPVLGHQIQSDSQIEFVGPKYGCELQKEYAAADLFVLPTHSENFGSVVIEALACGVPVITTKQAPWAELEEFGCGWWIDDTVDALAVALRDAIERKPESTASITLEEMGRRGRNFVNSRYTWSVACGKMLNAYESVLK